MKSESLMPDLNTTTKVESEFSQICALEDLISNDSACLMLYISDSIVVPSLSKTGSVKSNSDERKGEASEDFTPI